MAHSNPFPLWGIALITLVLLLTACALQVEPPNISVPLPTIQVEPPNIPELLPAKPSPAPTPLVLGLSKDAIPLTVAPVPDDLPRYDRKEWRHWVDQDRDCQDARQEVLIAESEIEVTFKSSDNCRVASGRWTGPYTGAVVDDPTKLDVDHVVPLANAHRSGGWAWTRDQKRANANALQYPEHLAATTAAANRAKGSDGPEDWRPPDTGYWCTYAQDWIAIKSRWGLTATQREYRSPGNAGRLRQLKHRPPPILRLRLLLNLPASAVTPA